MYGDRFLLTLLQARRALGVTDPRDMLYAHSTIARSAELVDEYRELIKVDYSRSCQKLYMDTARYFFEKSSGTAILSFVEDIELEIRRSGLASWAPDWTVSQPPKPWISVHDLVTTTFRSQRHEERYVDARHGHISGRHGVHWSTESDLTHAWCQEVLANVGVHVGTIGATSQVINRHIPAFDMEMFFARE